MRIKSFISTVEGQKQMCSNAAALAPWLAMNNKIQKLGGEGWPQSMIEQAPEHFFNQIKDSLTNEYNSLLELQKAKS